MLMLGSALIVPHPHKQHREHEEESHVEDPLTETHWRLKNTHQDGRCFLFVFVTRVSLGQSSLHQYPPEVHRMNYNHQLAQLL